MLASGASARIEVGEIAHQFVSFVDAGPGFGGTRFGAAAQPFKFDVHAILERVLMFLLGVEIVFLGFQKFTVIPGDAEETVIVGAVEFDHRVGDVFQEVAVVANHHAGKWGVLQHGFEPLDAFKIEVIGGLVEKENGRLLNECRGDGQTFAPATGKRVRDGIVVFKAGATELPPTHPAHSAPGRDLQYFSR